MENKNLLAYIGDDILTIEQEHLRKYSSEKLEIIGINYTNNRQLIILFRMQSQNGVDFVLKDEKVIINFCLDMDTYDFVGDSKIPDFKKLKGKEVEVFYTKYKKNTLKPCYILAISPIYNNPHIKPDNLKGSKVIEDNLNFYGNNLKDWELEDILGNDF